MAAKSKNKSLAALAPPRKKVTYKDVLVGRGAIEAKRGRKIKKKKAGDKQGWRGEWLLEGGVEIEKSVVNLFNAIQSTSWLPDQWNEIHIKSLHKKGSKQDLENKRGIFLANILMAS